MSADTPAEGAFVDLPQLLADAVAEALRHTEPQSLIDWLRGNLARYATSDSPLRHDPDVRRALAFAFGRALWSALPQPRRDFHVQPLSEPGRNEPCPCGSGEKYKHCCQRSPSMGVLTTRTLWPFVFAALHAEGRAAAIASRQLPRDALLEIAVDELDAGRWESVVELLEPWFTPEPKFQDELAASALTTLCDAYEKQRGGKTRKRALLKRMAELPDRSPLKSDALQRLSTIAMDGGKPAQAWQLFKQAQQTNPGDPLLGSLEVQLLLAEGRVPEAKQRARFFLGQLERRREPVDPELLEYYRKLAQDPERSLADTSMEMEDGAGRALADWLDRLQSRPVPRYRLRRADELPVDGGTGQFARYLRQMGIAEASIDREAARMQREVEKVSRRMVRQGGRGRGRARREPDVVGEATPGEMVIETPATAAALEAPWREVFPLSKPLSVQLVPQGGTDVWDPEVETQWAAFLGAHPDAFDSLEILDDLAGAVARHPQAEQQWLFMRLAEPLLRRSQAILNAAVAEFPAVRLPWPMTDNRAALRALVRLVEVERSVARLPEAAQLCALVLRLNPGDNHGLRWLLPQLFLEVGDAEACAGMAAAWPDDPAPELRFSEALALFQLGKARSASEALLAAHRASPRVAGFLLPARVSKPKLSDIGVSFDGDDRAWLYRDAMRDLWKRTPGALAWAGKVLGH